MDVLKINDDDDDDDDDSKICNPFDELDHCPTLVLLNLLLNLLLKKRQFDSILNMPLVPVPGVKFLSLSLHYWK